MGAASGSPGQIEASEGSDVVSAELREAVRDWAKTVRGVPLRFDEMVYLVRREEEILTRVATEIQRRSVIEQRAPAEQGRRPTGRRMDPRTIDPFKISPEELRAATEDVDTCAKCGGRGAANCGACAGTRSVRCNACNGGGRVTGGAAPCLTCRGAGGLACAPCGGHGVMACGACRGSGVEQVWLTYEHVTRIDVRIAPEVPLIALHPQLRDLRILAKSDLAPFTILAAAMAPGVVPSSALSYDEFEKLQERAPTIDRRIERVSQQQYLRFAIVRHELGYDMCGTRARLVLSGAKFAVEITPEALQPIHRRLVAWCTGGALLAASASVAAWMLRGPTAYFKKSNLMIEILVAVGTLAAVVLFGGVLRAVGPRFRIGYLMLIEKILAIVPVLSVIGVVVVKSTIHPTAVEARGYMAAGNVAKVNVVLEALDATHSEPAEVAALRDEIAYDEAQKLSGDERLARLDLIAAQGGTRAAEAFESARKERIARVHALLDQKKLTAALDLIDRTFTDAGRDKVDARELRASVHDIELELCVSDPCRFVAAHKADSEMSTPARLGQVRAVRTKMSDAVSMVEIPGETTLLRLQRLRALEATAQSVAGVASADDGELVERAKSAGKWAASERAKVPLLGSDRATLEELLGHLDDHLHASIENIGVYVSMDKSTRCSGVYVVGDSATARKEGLKSDYLPALILLKALGRPSALRRPAKDDATADMAWTDGTVPVAARWREGALVEVRIGDAVSTAPPSKPRPLGPAKLATVSFVAYPGGEVFIDGVSAGRDATAPMKLKAGKHDVTIKNRYLGDDTESVAVKDLKDTDGKPSTVTLLW